MTALRICFVGDSLTQGTLDHECLGWPGRLGRRETAAGHDVTVYNLGIRAETSVQIAARWRAEAETRLLETFAGALVFSFGINDMAEERGSGLRVPLQESVATAREILLEAKAWKPVLWVGPVPADMSRQPFSPGPGISYDFDNQRTRELSTAYEALARALDVPYLDLFETLAKDPGWQGIQSEGDGVHPPSAGYARMAELIGDWAAWRAWFD